MRKCGQRMIAVLFVILLMSFPVMGIYELQETSGTMGQSSWGIALGTSVELKGSLSFTRVDAVTGETVNWGERFYLYKVIEGAEDEQLAYILVPTNGSLYVYEGLELGRYYIKQKEWGEYYDPTYQWLEEPIYFEITADNPHVTIVSKAVPNFADRITWMQFWFLGLDENGMEHRINDAEFWLYRMDENGEFTIFVDILITEDNGNAGYGLIHNDDWSVIEFTMPEGYYMLVQKNCPEGFLPLREPHIFLAYYDAKQGTDFYLETEKIPGYGEIELQKLDAEKKTPLPGAVFKLYYQLYGSEAFIGRYTTDSNGKISMGNLMPGDYRLVETEAPEGYLLPERADREQYFSMVFDAETGQVLSYQGEATGLLTVYNRKKDIPPPVTEPENPGTTEPEKPGITEPEKPDTTRPGGNGGGGCDKDPGTDVPDDHSKKDNSKNFGGSVTISEEDVPLATQLITLIDEEDVPISNVDIPNTGKPAGSAAIIITAAFLAICSRLRFRQHEE